MPTFNNGERGDSIRTKLNNVINRTERAMLLDDVTQLASLVYTADSQWTVSAGMQVHTVKEGFAYEVLASGASTFDIQPGAVKLDLLPMANGAYNFKGMLPAADGTTDDYPLLRKLLDKPGSGLGGWYQAGPSIYIPLGVFRINTTVELKRGVRIYGDGGLSQSYVGILRFPANTMGFVVNRFNTLNGTTETVPTTAADGTIIEGIVIESLGGTDRTKHGIWMRARAAVVACEVRGFPGNGIEISATAGGGGAVEGNASSWYLERVRCSMNKNHGLFVDGPDANVGTAVAVDCASNGRCGIYDSSFLGNVYIGCHTASNGVATQGGNSASQSSLVLYAGNFWIAHWNATEAQLVATEPGTDPNVWIDRGAGYSNPFYPTWTAGQPTGTYFVAYAYRTDDVSAPSVFVGCYNESDHDVAISNPAYMLGGLMSNVRRGQYLGVGVSGLFTFPGLASNGGNSQSVRITDGTAYETWVGTVDEFNETWRWKRTANGGIRLDSANSAFRVPLDITGAADTVPWRLSLPSGFLLGGKRFDPGTAAPTSGTYARGDRVFNTNPAVGQPKGWICTVAGTPGTWVSEGNL